MFKITTLGILFLIFLLPKDGFSSQQSVLEMTERDQVETTHDAPKVVSILRTVVSGIANSDETYKRLLHQFRKLHQSRPEKELVHSLRKLADIYAQQGKDEIALSLFIETGKLAEVEGFDRRADPFFATLLYRISNLFLKEGNKEKALHFLKHAQFTAEFELGQWHELTLRYYDELGWLNYEAGQYKQAYKNASIFSYMLRLQKEEYPLYVFRTYHLMANSLRESKEYYAADQMYQIAFNLLENINSKNIKEYGALYGDFGRYYLQTKEFSKAKEMLQAALPYVASVHGADAPQVIKLQEDIALVDTRIILDTRKYTNPDVILSYAEEDYKVYPKREEIPERHFKMLWWLAFNGRGAYQRTLPLYLKTYFDETYDPNETEFSFLTRLADSFAEQKNYSEAVMVQNLATSRLEKMNPMAKELPEAYGKRISYLLFAGENVMANQLILNLQEYAENVLEPQSDFLTNYLQTVVQHYRNIQDFETANKIAENILLHLEKRLGSSNQETVQQVMDLAVGRWEEKEYGQADFLVSRAWRSISKKHSDDADLKKRLDQTIAKVCTEGIYFVAEYFECVPYQQLDEIAERSFQENRIFQ